MNGSRDRRRHGPGPRRSRRKGRALQSGHRFGQLLILLPCRNACPRSAAGPRSAEAMKTLTLGTRGAMSGRCFGTGVGRGRKRCVYRRRIGTEAGGVYSTAAAGGVTLTPGAAKPQQLSLAVPPAGTLPAGTYTLLVRLSAELNVTDGQTVALIPVTIARAAGVRGPARAPSGAGAPLARTMSPRCCGRRVLARPAGSQGGPVARVQRRPLSRRPSAGGARNTWRRNCC